MKFYHSNMPNAPILSRSAGSLMALLNACLVDGFGLKTVTDLTVTGNVATLTVAAPHSAVVRSTVLVEGATPAALNGEFVVSAITATTISFPIVLANQTATGSITVKQASAGWLKPFTSGNIAVYKSNDPTGTQKFLRVDDSPTVNARVVGYDTMTAVSTGSGLFPSSAQQSGGLYWAKGHAGESRNVAWWIFADSRSFYYVVAPGLTSNNTLNHFSAYHFGDLIARKSVDPYACAITGDIANQTDNTGAGAGIGCVGFSDRTPSGIPDSTFITRSHTGLGTSVTAKRFGAGHIGTAASAYSGSSEVGSEYGLVGTPNPADNGIMINSVLALSNSSIRGEFAGVWHVSQNGVNSIATTGDTLECTGQFSGKTAVAITVGVFANEFSKGLILFNTTGDWR